MRSSLVDLYDNGRLEDASRMLLFAAFQDGTLQKSLMERAARFELSDEPFGGQERAAPELGRNLDIARLRQEAVTCLAEAVLDGSLRAELEKQTNAEMIRERMRSSLVDLYDNGRLEDASRMLLFAALQDGTLQKSLKELAARFELSNESFGGQERAAPLVDLYDNGRLEDASRMLGPPDNSAGTSLEDLRQQAQRYLEKAAQNGTLNMVLGAVDGPIAVDCDTLLDNRKQACADLENAAKNGVLENAAAQIAMPGSGKSDVNVIKTEMSATFLKAATDGTLQQALVECKKTKGSGKAVMSMNEEAPTEASPDAAGRWTSKPSVGTWLLSDPSRNLVPVESIQQLRAQAHGVLINACVDGRLHDVLASMPLTSPRRQ
jgi:hypothetical protein